MQTFNDFQDLAHLLPQTNNYDARNAGPESVEYPSLFSKNYFKNVVFEDPLMGFKTNFTDIQVINLIEKISNRNLRKLVWEFSRVYGTESDRAYHLRYILHTVCMMLLKKYGGQMLSFVYELDILQRDENLKAMHPNIFSINLKKEICDLDSIKIVKNETVKLIGFEISEYNKKPYMIICNSHGHLETRINEYGYIEPEFIDRLRFNIFEFFNDSEITYFGAILNAYCSNCNRELTNPTSIFYGMGPVCRGDRFPF